MSVFPFGETSWVVLVLMLASSLGVAAMGVVWTFEGRLSRLPDATRLDDLRERAASMEEKIRDREEELRRLNQQIQDRDRLAGEALVLTQRVEALRAELAGLASAEQQIEEMKRRAAEAAEIYATEIAKRDEARTAREEMERGLRAAETRLAVAQREVDVIEERIKVGSAQLSELWEELQRLGGEKARIEREVAGLESIRKTLLATRDEIAVLAARKQAIHGEIEAIEDRLKVETARLDDVRSTVRTLKDEKAAIEREIAGLQETRKSLFAIREEVDVLAARREVIQREVDVLREKTATLAKGLLESNAPGHGPSSDANVFNDLRQAPACLRADWLAHPTQREEEALHDVIPSPMGSNSRRLADVGLSVIGYGEQQDARHGRPPCSPHGLHGRRRSPSCPADT